VVSLKERSSQVRGFARHSLLWNNLHLNIESATCVPSQNHRKACNILTLLLDIYITTHIHYTIHPLHSIDHASQREIHRPQAPGRSQRGDPQQRQRRRTRPMVCQESADDGAGVSIELPLPFAARPAHPLTCLHQIQKTRRRLQHRQVLARRVAEAFIRVDRGGVADEGRFWPC